MPKKKIEVVFFWWFWVGIFCVRSFPLLLSFSSFQSMIFSLFLWCTTFQLCATIAKLYYKGKYIVKERGMNQSEIFIGEKQYDSTTDSGLFTPSGKFSTQLDILSEQMHHLWLFQQLCISSLSRRWSMLPKKTHKKKNYHNYSFLEGKCHLELYGALNFYANICLHHHIKGLNSKSAQKGKTKSFYSSSPLTSWDK